MIRFSKRFNVVVLMLLCQTCLFAGTSDPVKMLNANNILEDIFKVPVLQNDSMYHQQKKDTYLDRCAKPHVHRYASRTVDTILFRNTGFWNDTVYSRLVTLMPLNKDSALAVFESVRPFYSYKTDTASLDVALYVFRNNKWSYILKNSLLASGSQGYGCEQVLRLGKSHIGIVLTTLDFNYSCFSKTAFIYSVLNNRFQKVRTLSVGYDNSLLMTDDYDDGPEFSRNGYYVDTTTLQAVPGKNHDWYDIKTSTKGISHYNDTITHIDTSRVYVFCGNKYVPADSLSIYTNNKNGAALYDTMQVQPYTTSGITRKSK